MICVISVMKSWRWCVDLLPHSLQGYAQRERFEPRISAMDSCQYAARSSLITSIVTKTARPQLQALHMWQRTSQTALASHSILCHAAQGDKGTPDMCLAKLRDISQQSADAMTPQATALPPTHTPASRFVRYAARRLVNKAVQERPPIDNLGCQHQEAHIVLRSAGQES